MEERDKTREQLIDEISELRQRIVELETAEFRWMQGEEAQRLSGEISGRMPDAILLADQEGEPVGIGRVQKVPSERKQRPKARGASLRELARQSGERRSEELYQRVIKAADAVAYYRDHVTNTYRFVDEAIENLIGYVPGKFTPEIWRAIIRQEIPVGNLEGLTTDTARRKAMREVGATWRAEVLVKTRSGEERWLSDTAVQEGDAHGNVVGSLGILQDITARKRFEEEQNRFERLRALGEMAAGVSHNLNNILTSVLGPAQMLQRTSDDPNVQEEAQRIVAAARHARDLVHRLHLSTRGTEEDKPQAVQVNEVALQAVQVTCPRWKDAPEARGLRIEVATDLGDVPPIKGAESRLHDIFVNLLLNAVDAMPKGGTITVCTRAVDKGVQITVSDTGIGMDEETRRRVFEPFFTTKMDVGSGLGLSTVYGAVTTWGGDARVESKPGKGTTFTIRLPAWTAPEVSREVTATVRQARHGKLLLVEDDKEICDLLSRLLGRHYEVETAWNGEAALGMFAPGKYDVALIDLGMPGIAGDRVLREIHRADAALATVLVTGWELDDGDPRLSRFDFRVQKPFDDINEVENVVALAAELHDRRAEGKV